MKKWLILVLICVLGVSGLAFGGCKKKDKLDELGAGLTDYFLDINFNATNKKAEVYEKVNYKNTSNDILKKVCFHLYPQFFEEGGVEYIVPSTKMNTAYPNGMSYAKFNVSRVRVSGKEVVVKFLGECEGILEIDLPSDLLPEAKVEIEVDFDFVLPNCWHRFGFGDDSINLANFYPIACVYEDGEFNTSPYNANGDPFYSDVANYNVLFKVEEDFVVASSGVEIKSNKANGFKTCVFEAKAVRDFALVLSSRFKVLTKKTGDVLVEYYYVEDSNAEKSLETGIKAIKTFGKLFGDYPYKKFCIVQTDFIQGGMEYPGLVMISSLISSGDDYYNVIVHETAHQWWYGVVGNDEFRYPWLDEALTDYCTVLFYDYNDGYRLDHKTMIDIDRKNYALFKTVYEDVLGSLDTSMRAVDKYDTEPEYTYCTYVKGVLMYESLYTLIGEKKFVKALKTYYKENTFANVEPADLVKAFSEASKMDLNDFFDSWITGKVVIL